MLTIFDGQKPMNRRELLRVGTLGLGGLSFSSLLGVKALARLADKFTVVRSFSTENSGHNIQPIVSSSSREANFGVHYSRVAGVTRPNSGVPTNVVLFPRSVDAHVPGPYSKGFAPFILGKGDCRTT